MARVITYMAEGLEEVECLAVVDLLRRAGVEVVMTSITDKAQVTGSHGFVIGTDKVISEVDPLEADMIFLPGGMPGTKNLEESEELVKDLKKAADAGRKLAAICAAPRVLGMNHLLEGKKATCYPGNEEKLLGAVYCHDGVVTDGNVSTARGLGYALELGIELIRILCGEEKAQQIYDAIQME